MDKDIISREDELDLEFDPKIIMSSKFLNIASLLEKIHEDERSLIITLPATVSWKEYEKDFEKVNEFQVTHFPKGVKEGSRCYIVYNGKIKGWQEITGFKDESFSYCFGSVRHLKFIQRSGKFHYLEKEIPYKGFNGFRYFNYKEYNLD